MILLANVPQDQRHRTVDICNTRPGVSIPSFEARAQPFYNNSCIQSIESPDQRVLLQKEYYYENNITNGPLCHQHGYYCQVQRVHTCPCPNSFLLDLPRGILHVTSPHPLLTKTALSKIPSHTPCVESVRVSQKGGTQVGKYWLFLL